MRPERLIMEAFGPFGDGLTVDFRGLAPDALFLIHGPTGSGKSTILDAMCFALYGESSGTDRLPEQLRSDHAPPTRPTRVVFDFALGPDRWRVERTPPQVLAKTRGTGVRANPSKAELWRRTDCSDDEDGIHVASQPTKVTAEIERLLGLSSAQFRQLIVLPQGRFRDFLSASTATRQTILASLFGTEIYQRLTAALKEKAALLEVQVRDALSASRALLEAEGVASAAELDDVVAAVRSDVERSAARVAAATVAQDQARAALDQARETLRRLDERRVAAERLTACEAEKPAVAELETRLERARRAEPLRHLGQAAGERSAEKTSADAARSAAEGELAQGRVALASASETLASEQAREGERTAARLEADRLAALGPVVEGLARDRTTAERTAAEEKRARLALERERTSAKELERRLVADDALVDEARATAAQAPAHRAALAELERRRTALSALHLIEKALAAARAAEETASTALARHDAELATARVRVDELTARWTTAQAAILARELGPGCPCPVCGSTEHPSLATDDSQAPSDAALKKARTDLSRLEGGRPDLETARTAAVGERTRREAELEAAGRSSGSEDLQTLERERAKTAELLTLADAAVVRASAAEAQRSSRRQALERTRGLAADAETTLARVAAAAAEAAALFKQHESLVPAEVREPSRLNAAVRTAVARCQALDAALEKARVARDQADLRRAAAERAVDETSRRALQAAESADRAAAAFRTALSEAGFADDEDHRRSCLAGDERQGLEKHIEEFGARLEAARRRRTETEEAARDLAPPDLPRAETELRAAAALLAQATTDHGAVTSRLTALERRVVEVAKLSQRQGAAETEHRVLGHLAGVASGRNDSRIDLERYVLATLLEDVLTAATGRLAVMSRGRYALRRQAEPGKKNHLQGLDLEVLDSHTGRPRPASTLSGGEGFMAALALALGLADTVSAYAGGRRMEAIFVDEGFGSLDDEALEQAFQVLVSMKGEGRLLGVISHVAELRRWVGVRLEMGNAHEGSVLRIG